MNHRIFHSKILTVFTLFLFIILLSSDVLSQRNVSPVDDIEKLIKEGKTLYENGEYEKAKNTFLQAVTRARKTNERSEVYFNLSLAYYATGQNEKTKETLEKLFGIQPKKAVDERYFPSGFMEIFNQVRGKGPVVAAKPGIGKPAKKGGGGGLFIILGLLGGGGAAAALLLGKKGGNGGGGSSEPTTGSIQVNSTPTGAKVFLDGNDTGKTTNTTLTDVSPGSHTIKLAKDGYVDYQESVSVSAGQTTTVSATLTPHTISVTSPTSSTTWVKGKEVEIKWSTSQSARFPGSVSTSSGINPFSPGSIVSPSFQRRRAFQYRRSFPDVKRPGRQLEGMESSEEKELNLNKLSKFQDISKKVSSPTKDVGAVNHGEKDIDFIKRNQSFGRYNFPGSAWVSPQKFSSSGDRKILSITNVKIDLYKGGSQVKTIVSSTDNDGSYTWTVDTALQDGSDYKIRVCCASETSIYGESSSFKIEEKSITVTQPTSSTAWSKGSSATIEWTWKGSISYVKIELYKGSSVVKTIDSYEYNYGSYTWSTVDTSLADGTDYKVRITDYYDSSVYGESAQFQITSPSFTITNPTSSTVWYKGSSAAIEWTTTGSISYVDILLYKGTTLKKTIEYWEYNDGSYTWSTVDSSLEDGTNYKVRISDYYNSSVYGESAEFQITSPSFTITNPTSSTAWYKGGSATIEWTTTSSTSYVEIQLYKGTTLKKTIASWTSNDGSYTWSTVDSSLEDGTDYKVRIVDENNTSIYGDSAQFTIESAITVTKPTSSTKWNHGQSAEITWTSKGSISNVKIDLYKGSTLKKTIVSSTENDGAYTWSEVETALTDGTDYKVRITDGSNSSIYGESDYFQIGEPGITVTKPTSSTVWYKGGSGSIEWTYKGDINYVKIDLYKGNTWVKLITSSTYNWGDYTWSTVDTSLEDGTDYNVKVTSTSDSSLYDYSDQFEITSPTITVTKPTSSTVWYKGGSGSIEWTYTGDINYVKIDLYKGSTWKTLITSSTYNDGSHSWTVDTSLENGTDYKVKVTSTSDSNVYDYSDQFEIASPSITVTNPTSSTIWYKGGSGTIEWTSNGASSYVIIELYKGTTLKKTISTYATNDGSYTWSTVDTSLESGTDYKVRVSDQYNSSCYNDSAQFEIAPSSITVTSPTSSTVSTKGQYTSITWTSKGGINYVSIQLYKGTTLNSTITSFTSNDGSHSWYVSSSLEDGTDYKVRVTDYYDSSVYGESAQFKIQS